MKLHISNSTNRDATILATSVVIKDETITVKDGKPVTFKRYVAAGEGKLNEDLVAQFGADYSAELIKGDP